MERDFAETAESGVEDAAKVDDIQIGQVEEYIEAGPEEDVIMDDDPPELAMPEASSSDLGLAGP